MGDVVDRRGRSLSLEDNHDFVSDCARYGEGLLSEEAVRRKYCFDDGAWRKLGDNEALIEAIEAEKIRRVRDGSAARERAQQLFATAPSVLGDILHDDSASPRHRIESARELRQIAANGPEAAPAADRFVITINLGAEVLHFDKSIAIDANDIDPNDTHTAPQGLPAIVAANQRKDDGGGDPL
jgi:archaeosine-15-forming tRNA-guanine transglycosylase